MTDRMSAKDREHAAAVHAAVEALPGPPVARYPGPTDADLDRREHAEGLFWEALRELDAPERRSLLMRALHAELDQ